MDFLAKLESATNKNNSLLCIGLDPDPKNLLGSKDQFEFNKKIIDKTADLVCTFKPQIAFYSAFGLKGIEDLKKTIDYIHNNCPTIPVILDAKRGDVGHTAEMYTKEVFDFFQADATTVNPYCGFDSVEPFFKRENKGVFIICKTSNPSAADFQDINASGQALYVHIARQVTEWNKRFPNAYIEIGATWPKEIGVLREIAKEIPFLIAGIGAQGGDLGQTLKNGLRKDKQGLIISSSRGIIYAQNPRSAALKLRDEINKYR